MSGEHAHGAERRGTDRGAAGPRVVGAQRPGAAGARDRGLRGARAGGREPLRGRGGGQGRAGARQVRRHGRAVQPRSAQRLYPVRRGEGWRGRLCARLGRCAAGGGGRRCVHAPDLDGQGNRGRQAGAARRQAGRRCGEGAGREVLRRLQGGSRRTGCQRGGRRRRCLAGTCPRASRAGGRPGSRPGRGRDGRDGDRRLGTGSYQRQWRARDGCPFRPG